MLNFKKKVTNNVALRELREPGITQLTLRPPWAYCELTGHIRVWIRKEGRTDGCHVCSCGSQRADRVSTFKLREDAKLTVPTATCQKLLAFSKGKLGNVHKTSHAKSPQTLIKSDNQWVS